MNGMMKPRFALSTLSTLIALSISTTTFASDFSLPFVNGSELGNAYAGWAASATDASTSYTNPAGLIKLKSPQIVVAGVDVRGFSQFKGTSTTPFATQFGQVTGTAGGFLPLFDLAIPINDKFVFGFSETAPFGLGNNYPTWSVVRYAATRSQLIVVDLSPSIGYKINDKLSVGAGFDAQRVAITLNAMMPMPFSLPDAQGQNHLTGWGYGFHAGILDQINESTRVGLSFNSQTTFSPSGDSVVYSSMGT
ncbi:MAG: outer membrane protein transport protein, partial [Gammaproteobacteria bacterium]